MAAEEKERRAKGRKREFLETCCTLETTRGCTSLFLAPGWKERSGLDCYAGKGGFPIQPDPFSTKLAVADCRAACDSRPSCEGIVTGTSGQCYLRTQLDLSKCVRDPSWTLHLAPRFSGPVSPPKTTTRRPSGGFGCVGGVQSYPRSLPNSHYYRQLCTTSKGLRIVSAGRASGRALERTAFLLSQVGWLHILTRGSTDCR